MLTLFRFEQKKSYLLSLLFCLGMLGTALYLEQVDALAPCPLCELQRLCFLVIILFSIMGLLLRLTSGMIRWLSGIIIFFSFCGAALAIHQLWLEAHPPAVSNVCGMDLTYLLNMLPFFKALKVALMGTGDCAVVNWRLLGLSIPGWSLIAFVLLIALSAYQCYRTKVKI